VYVAPSFARLEVPEGEVEELADGTWLVMADKPVVFAVGEDGAVVELSLTPCGVECVGELKRVAALAAIGPSGPRCLWSRRQKQLRESS